MRPLQAHRDEQEEDVTEKQFQSQVIALARLHRWVVYHTHDSRRSAAGFPDLLCLHPTRGILVAELKRVGKQPTAAQRAWLRSFETAGVPAYVWTEECWDEIETVLGVKVAA